MPDLESGYLIGTFQVNLLPLHGNNPLGTGEACIGVTMELP